VVTVVLCMIAFSLLAVKFATILYILICGCIGLVIYLIKHAKHGKEGAT
jgi:chromate transport protein ChrA